MTPQSVQRLLECTSLGMLWRTLLDMGFGAGGSFAAEDFDALFAYERERQRAFLCEFNVDGALDAFLLEYDFLNLKSVLKAQACGKRASVVTTGLVGAEELEQMALQTDEEKIPPFFREAIVQVRALGENPNPRLIDTAVDKQANRMALAKVKRGDKLLRAYFVQKTDQINLISFLRCKKLDLSAKFYGETFLEGGELELASLYDQPLEKLRDAVKGRIYAESFFKALDDGNIIAFEVACDNALLQLVEGQRDDMFSLAPILAYYLCREAAIKTARLIVAGVRNGVEPSAVRERLRDV